MLRPVPAEIEAELGARLHERDREVAVDVRVHAAQRELDRCDARTGAFSKQGSPRTRWIVERVEVESGEADVQLRQERRCREARLRVVYGLGHREVQPREAGDPVPLGKTLEDRSHALADVGDRLGLH